MSTTAVVAPKTAMQRFLDGVERVGNMVPHPVVIFLILIGIVIALSAVLSMFGAAVRFERINPDTHQIETATTAIRSLMTSDGIRFMYASLIPNFMSFTAVGLMIVAMIGAGVAEESGLVTALIRKLVIVSPAWALTYILSFVGILSSIAADAGYLVLIPLAGVAYLAVGRNPLAGLALGFAAVAGAFTVNMLIKPLDAVLVEFTNDAARLVDPARSIGLTSNLWFSIVSVLFLTAIVAFITDRMIAPRLGSLQSRAGGRRHHDEPGRHSLRNGIARTALRRLRASRPARRVPPPDGALRSAAAQSRHGRADRQLALHERADRADHADVPGDRLGLRRRRGHVADAHRGDPRDRKVDQEHGRHDLPVLRPQPVRRLLHLHQHGHGHGAQPVRRPAGRQYRGAATCSSASSSSSRSSTSC